jgi:hypothetical protein
VGRGANLDTIDVPLNNERYLLQEFAKLLSLTENQRIEGILKILNWKNPGEGTCTCHVTADA